MRSGVKTKFVTAIVAASLSLTGCATTGTEKLETVEERIGQCIATALAGALVGGIIGNNTGNGDAGSGALAGALFGGAACAAWQAWDSQQDQMRIQQAQIEALRTQQPQRVEYYDEAKKQQKVIQVSNVTQVSDPRANAAPASGAAPDVAAAPEALCYTMTTSLSSTGNQDATLNPTYCDDGAGGFVQVS